MTRVFSICGQDIWNGIPSKNSKKSPFQKILPQNAEHSRNIDYTPPIYLQKNKLPDPMVKLNNIELTIKLTYEKK